MRRFVLLPLFCASLAIAQAPVRYAREPFLSPDGTKIVFEWCRDIFIADLADGRASALTSHHAVDTSPMVTRDGQAVVFMSNRSGNWDLYRMPIGGGEPTRLTWYAGTDRPIELTADGQSLLIESRRFGPAQGTFGWSFVLPLAGGTPTTFMKLSAGDVAVSPDGNKVAFVRNRSDLDWREYKGGLAEDLWIWDKQANTYTKITDYPGPDLRPMWSADGQTLFFMSDRSGDLNLWKMPAAGGAAEPVSTHDFPIRAASINATRDQIAYECDGDVYLQPTAGGAPRKLSLTGPTDVIDPEMLYETRTGDIGEYAVAPSGREVAFVVRGDIYVARYPDGGPTAQITNTPCEEGGLAWSEDSKTLWFHSDREGQFDLYTVTSGDAAEPRLRRTRQLAVTRRTETPENEINPAFSPDWKKLGYTRKNDLIIANADLSEPKTIVSNPRWIQWRWSPDSRWLCYSVSDDDSNSDVWIVPVEGGEPTNVSMQPGWDSEPVFSGDMSKLAFLSARNEGEPDVYYVWLRYEDWIVTQSDRDDREDDEFDKPKPPEPKPEDKPAEGQPPAGAAPNTAAPAGEGAKPEEKPAEPARIDLDEIHERLVRLTSTEEGESGLIASPDGKQFGFVASVGGSRELVVTGWERYEPRPLSQGGAGALEWSRDGRTIRYLSGGRVTTANLAGGPPKTTSHEARIERVIAEERAYVFDTVWATMRDAFYDPKMHGVDWPAMREYYRPRALSTPSREDFARVVNEMLGELKASHLGYGAPGRPVTPTGPSSAALGIVFGNDRSKPGLEVESVEPESPAARVTDGPKPGERLVGIDGQAVDPSRDVFELLVGQAGQRVAVEIEAADGTRRTVSIRAVSTGEIAGQRYPQWLKRNREQTKQLSGGRLGYLHVSGMNRGAVNTFYRDLYAAGAGKEGLVVDVRFNGGGNTHEYLLEALSFRPHTYMVDRDATRPGFPAWLQPVPVYRFPSIVLHNQNSASDAELFSWAFKNLGLGITVGTPTWGGVIFTGGRGLVDGSNMRIPGSGAYMMDGTNLEANPVVPDLPVEISPADELADRDPQLETAVRALLERIDAQPKP